MPASSHLKKTGLGYNPSRIRIKKKSRCNQQEQLHQNILYTLKTPTLALDFGSCNPHIFRAKKTILLAMVLLGSLKIYFYFRWVSLPSRERSHIPPRKTIRSQLPLKGIWIRSLEGIFRKIHLASTLFAIFPFAALGQGRPVFTV